MTEPKIGDWCWHIHHDLLLEPLSEPFENRVEYIKLNKSPDEIPMRLRLFKPVNGTIFIPSYIAEANEKLAEVNAEYKEVDDKFLKAYSKLITDRSYSEWVNRYTEWRILYMKWYNVYVKRYGVYEKWQASPEWSEIADLHEQECPNCPWDGKSILSQQIQ